MYSNGFFVQTILADRYNHRRELWVVSLESLSSVEYGIKKTVSILAFYSELSMFKVFVNIRRNSAVFIHIFAFFNQIFVNFAKIC